MADTQEQIIVRKSFLGELVGTSFLLAGVLILLSLISYTDRQVVNGESQAVSNIIGTSGHFTAFVLLYVFGNASYLLAPFLGLMGVLCIYRGEAQDPALRLAAGIILCVALAIFIQLIGDGSGGHFREGGGVIGHRVGQGLSYLFGMYGALILTVGLAFTGGFLATRLPIKEFVSLLKQFFEQQTLVTRRSRVAPVVVQRPEAPPPPEPEPVMTPEPVAPPAAPPPQNVAPILPSAVTAPPVMPAAMPETNYGNRYTAPEVEEPVGGGLEDEQEQREEGTDDRDAFMKRFRNLPPMFETSEDETERPWLETLEEEVVSPSEELNRELKLSEQSRIIGHSLLSGQEAPVAAAETAAVDPVFEGFFDVGEGSFRFQNPNGGGAQAPQPMAPVAQAPAAQVAPEPAASSMPAMTTAFMPESRPTPSPAPPVTEIRYVGGDDPLLKPLDVTLLERDRDGEDSFRLPSALSPSSGTRGTLAPAPSAEEEFLADDSEELEDESEYESDADDSEEPADDESEYEEVDEEVEDQDEYEESEDELEEDEDEEEDEAEEDEPEEEPVAVAPVRRARPEPVPEPLPAIVTSVIPVKPTGRKYRVPLDLLNLQVTTGNEDLSREIEVTRAKLEVVLRDYGIQARVVKTQRGPIITLYEVKLEPGVKVSRILGIQDEIKMNLEAAAVRIMAPIPGKSTVGIEIPNKIRETIYLGDINRKDKDFFSKDRELTIVLGKDIAGKNRYVDLAKSPHLLIAGATGAGKSVYMNSVIASLLYLRSPMDVRFIMIDPKMVELTLFEGIPHLLMPVITDIRKASKALNWAVQEMEQRYASLSRLKCRDIRSFNERLENDGFGNIKGVELPTEKMPYIVVLIDELSDLMMVAAKDVEDSIIRLTQKARAVGIHVIMATQRPSVDVITALIKANCPARIAFQVAQRTDSRTILDANGAETLLGRGDLLYKSPSAAGLERIQAPLITDTEIEKVVRETRKYGEPTYVELPGGEGGSEGGFEESDEDMELFDRAWEIVEESGKTSTSYIQRRLRIGYNRAARLIEMMEEKGYLGPLVGNKPREILKKA